MTLKSEAQPRTITGRKINSLRRQGILPANIYGQGVKSLSISLPLAEFNKLYQKAGETSLVELSIGKDVKTVLISDVQIDPVSAIPIHVDFKEVNLKKKVSATVPVEIEGEAPAEKQGLGTLIQLVSELQVEALPLDLPEKIIADVSGLDQVDSVLYVKDLPFDRTKLTLEAKEDLIIVSIQEIKEEVIVEPVAETPTEPAPTVSETEEPAPEA